MGLRHPVFIPLALLVLQTLSFELQDTIHTLKEEIIHLHDQLENLTQALRDLKRMLWHNSNAKTILTSGHSTRLKEVRPVTNAWMVLKDKNNHSPTDTKSLHQ